MKPKYRHDCTSCIFLGIDAKGRDLYVCLHTNRRCYQLDTLICRYGNEAYEYRSCSVDIVATADAKFQAGWAEALRLAEPHRALLDRKENHARHPRNLRGDRQ